MDYHETQFRFIMQGMFYLNICLTFHNISPKVLLFFLKAPRSYWKTN